MDVEVVLFENLSLFREKRLDQCDRNAGGFLHDVSELAGDQDLALALGEQSLDIENFTAGRRPGQSCDDTGIGFFLDHLVIYGVHVEIIAEIFFGHDDLFPLAPHDPHCGGAAESLQTFAQSAHTALLGVIGDDESDHVIGEFDLVRADADCLKCLGQQMPLGDLQFVCCCIALELDDLHPVEQGLGNGLQRICCADEKDVGQIIGRVHVVVGESAVLFGIKYFEQSAGRVPVVGDGELVDLVEHHDRVGDAALLNAVHDPAGHGSDVSASVPPDIRFVAHTAKAYTGILAVECPGDTLSDAGLAGAGRSDKAENRT